MNQAAATSLSLNDLIALNDELTGLVRAGVPLERHLAATGRDLPRRLKHVTQQLTARLEQGETLPDAVANLSQAGVLPDVYAAVLRAALRSADPARTLEAVGTTSRRLAEVHRVISAALWYPAIVLLTAYGVFVLLLLLFSPLAVRFYRDMQLPSPGWAPWLTSLGGSLGTWGWFPPLLFLVLLFGWWFMAGRSASLAPGWSRWLYFWCPWFNKLIAHSEAATFTEFLSLLIGNDVPLPESLRLAAAASGSARLQQTAEEVAAQLEAGGAAAPLLTAVGLPPLVRVQLATSQQSEHAAASLANLAASYHHRAMHDADRLQTYVPVVLSVSLGVVVAALYILVWVQPFTHTLEQLAI